PEIPSWPAHHDILHDTSSWNVSAKTTSDQEKTTCNDAIVSICVALCEVIAAMGEAHSHINIFNGYTYPLQFYIFDGNLYVINADKNLAEWK
ncbi:MAG: hypothetical protein FWD61_12925, partial [Phycisphaerales bacterium]|nr:hypothetical protein [Phycisphaerales bacterium]